MVTNGNLSIDNRKSNNQGVVIRSECASGQWTGQHGTTHWMKTRRRNISKFPFTEHRALTALYLNLSGYLAALTKSIGKLEAPRR